MVRYFQEHHISRTGMFPSCSWRYTMYCHNCGRDVRGGANFCENCGAPQIAPEETRDEFRPLLIIRPFFSPLVTLFKQIPVQILFTLWGGAVFGIAGYFIIKYLELPLSNWFFAILFGCLFFIITPMVYLFSMMNRYAKTEYKFYKNKLDYSEGVFTVGDKSVNFNGIIEVNLVRGVAQRMFGLGTIVLSTAATDDVISHSRREIRIADLEYPEIIYKKVKAIINR